jgi:hypothetical protein
LITMRIGNCELILHFFNSKKLVVNNKILPRYDWNIVESGVKYRNPNPTLLQLHLNILSWIVSLLFVSTSFNVQIIMCTYSKLTKKIVCTGIFLYLILTSVLNYISLIAKNLWWTIKYCHDMTEILLKVALNTVILTLKE